MTFVEWTYYENKIFSLIDQQDPGFPSSAASDWTTGEYDQRDTRCDPWQKTVENLFYFHQVTERPAFSSLRCLFLSSLLSPSGACALSLSSLCVRARRLGALLVAGVGSRVSGAARHGTAGTHRHSSRAGTHGTCTAVLAFSRSARLVLRSFRPRRRERGSARALPFTHHLTCTLHSRHHFNVSLHSRHELHGTSSLLSSLRRSSLSLIFSSLLFSSLSLLSLSSFFLFSSLSSLSSRTHFTSLHALTQSLTHFTSLHFTSLTQFTSLTHIHSLHFNSLLFSSSSSSLLFFFSLLFSSLLSSYRLLP